jgi:cytochrome oxidase Cu insertion factor (SCO1/SenC/PrrC family)
MRLGINFKTGIILAGALIALSLIAVYWGLSQANSGQPEVKLPAFKLKDVEGSTFNLYGRPPKPIIIHFMAVACGGGFSTINDVRLKELVKVKSSVGDDVEIVTVTITTCTTTDLVDLKRYYNVTWTFGNDYDDSKLDILESFKDYELTDGSLIISTSQNNMREIIRGEATAETLVGKLEARLSRHAPSAWWPCI